MQMGGEYHFVDSIVLKKIAEGDRQAFRFLFEMHYRSLCLYATQYTKNASKAEDIVQNVFMNLWAKRDRLKIQTSLKNYLFKSVYNTYINDYRKTQRREDLLDKLYYEALQKSIEDEEEHIQKRLEWLNREIEALPSKCREIFILNKRRGLTCKEISQMLDISELTVESHIGRALKRIRKHVPEFMVDFL